MYIPSLTTLLGGVFLAYICHSMWYMSQLFTTLKCTETPCFTYFLNENPRMQLALFTSPSANPIANEVTKIYSVKQFDYRKSFERNFEITLPQRTRRNGTLHLHAVLALVGKPLEWRTLRRDGPTALHTLRVSEYSVRRALAYKLLGSEEGSEKAQKAESNFKPVTHLMTEVFVTLLTDNVSLSSVDVPPELSQLTRITPSNQILPILRTDFFNMRLRNLEPLSSNSSTFNMRFNFAPVGTGRLRLMLLIEQAMGMVTQMGFTQRDVDEVKGMFSGTNLYLLLCTIFVASIHLLFDFLSFKNDVSFWRQKRSYAGLSTRTALWRAFSQIVIFLYLLDENSSMLVLLPAFIGALIELWKCKKLILLQHQTEGNSEERRTQQFDKEGMRYLSYLLYPLCVLGAIYSLLYTPHRSWYSWTLHSLVNGVYGFGFLFMLPQLFVNYKLKSVAALPWRAFMYKAFNTFIDDFFAFIITMPTMHRVACLRDDLVFLIYLYQRWLYPVDKTRIDTGLTITENVDSSAELLPANNKTNKGIPNQTKRKTTKSD